MPYEKMKERLRSEIERYDALIEILMNLPPRLLPNGDIAPLPDSIRQMMPKGCSTPPKRPLFSRRAGPERP